MEKLFKFEASFRRMGDLEGVFVATQEDIDFAIGKEAWFGEVLGKHSEIYLTLKESHFKEVTGSPEIIDILNTIGMSNSGHNPLDYVQLSCGCNPFEASCEECEDLDPASLPPYWRTGLSG